MTRNPGPGFAPPAYTPPIEMTKATVLPHFIPVIACVWWGNKYPISYVHRLKQACDKHMHMPYRFVVLTDHYDHNEMRMEGWELVHALPYLEGWWQKIALFNARMWSPTDRILMLDLDNIITGPLDDFFYSDHHTTAIANFGVNYRHSKYNSSVVCWEPHGPASRVFDEFVLAPQEIMGALHGDQCWFWRVLVDDVRVWPKDWCLSYKYDVKRTGLRPETRAVIFHGKPDPHEVRDPFAIEHWHSL